MATFFPKIVRFSSMPNYYRKLQIIAKCNHVCSNNFILFSISYHIRVGGKTYIRWGRTTCPKLPGTKLVYTGWAGGSHYTHRGGGSNYLCLTKQPQYLKFSSHINNRGLVYGAEYEASKDQPYGTMLNHDVLCSVCNVGRRAVLMIPGRYTCPSGWRREYYGYLMSEYHGHHRSMYECMDKSPEGRPGGYANHDGALFYQVEARCGSLRCPPYEQTKELTCAVCSR